MVEYTVYDDEDDVYYESDIDYLENKRKQMMNSIEMQVFVQKITDAVISVADVFASMFNDIEENMKQLAIKPMQPQGFNPKDLQIMQAKLNTAKANIDKKYRRQPRNNI